LKENKEIDLTLAGSSRGRRSTRV